MSISIRKDRWSQTEDEILKSAVMKYGTNQWNRVASLLPRKKASQCKSRWAEQLNPRIAARGWTHTEDQMLLELAKKMPNMWRSIGTALGNRTGQQSYERWQALQSLQARQGLQMPQKEAVDTALTENTPGDSESSEDEMGSDNEKQLLAEARARLSNSLGRKAKRKQRERIEDENKFLQSIERHRETGSRIAEPKSHLSVPHLPNASRISNVSHASHASRAFNKASTSQGPYTPSEEHQLRKPNRPKLELPPPQVLPLEKEEWMHVTEEERRSVLALLDNMPAPKGKKTLADIVSS